MGTLRRVSAMTFVAIILILGIYVGLRFLASWERHYSWKDMDWNQDGKTTVSEFLEASEIGHRRVSQDGKECRDYYALKDGLSIRMDCIADVNRQAGRQVAR